MQIVGTVLGILFVAAITVVLVVCAFGPYLLGMMNHNERRKR